VKHYIETIPHLSPSYVILKFVDPSQISYLTLYLQALHDANAGSQNHTNLLLNCYSKLKEDDKLEQLIVKGGFDIESGIRICRSAGYFKLALEIAKAAILHDWVITILFEDLSDPSQILLYISGLDESSIMIAMKKYGASIIKQLPKESTDILVRLCSDGSAYPEDFIPFFVDSRTWCTEFLERVFKNRFSSPNLKLEDREMQSLIEISNTLFELYLENYIYQSVTPYYI